MRTMIFCALCSLLVCTACSQKRIDETSYKAGKVAAEVVEAVEEGYHATVRGSKSAYRRMHDGYYDRRERPIGATSSNGNSTSDDAESSKAQQAPANRDGDSVY